MGRDGCELDLQTSSPSSNVNSPIYETNKEILVLYFWTSIPFHRLAPTKQAVILISAQASKYVHCDGFDNGRTRNSTLLSGWAVAILCCHISLLLLAWHWAYCFHLAAFQHIDQLIEGDRLVDYSQVICWIVLFKLRQFCFRMIILFFF